MSAGPNSIVTHLPRNTGAETAGLVGHLQSIRETERVFLARRLHDDLGALLVAAVMDIGWAEQHLESSGQVKDVLRRARSSLAAAIDLKRNLIEDLRPSLLDNLGLAPALEWHVTEHCKSAGLICTLDIADVSDVIDGDTSIAVYRIVQEALTNVIRHAKATRFELSLESDDGAIELRMRDNGVGLPASFSAAKLSHGLSGMRQRARALGGDIAWESAPRQGTRIYVRVPIRQHASGVIAADAMPAIHAAGLQPAGRDQAADQSSLQPPT